MAYTNATLETAALAISGIGTWISLHTADPGSTTGTAEASGGSPAYARKQTTWSGGVSDGNVVGSEVTLDLPAGTYTHFGIYTAATGGTFVGGGALNTSATLAAQGQVKVTPTIAVTSAA